MVVVLLVIALAVMSACASPEAPEPDIPEQELSEAELVTTISDEPVSTTLLQGTPTGVWFMLSNGISECLNKTYPGSLLQITPGTPSPNVSRLLNGDAEFILTHNSPALSALNGKDAFTEPHEELRGIMAFYTSPVQIVLREDLGIDSFDRIIEEQRKVKLSVGSKGGNMEEMFLRILGQYGVTLEEMEAWGCEFSYKTQEETARMFGDRALDGYLLTGSAPSPFITENAVNAKIVMAGIGDDIITGMCDTYGFEPYTIRAETYKFLTEDYQTFTDFTILATTDSVPAETAYKMTKAIHENLEYVQLIHASLKRLNEEVMVGKLKLPLHPGAEQYYREIGLID